MTDLKIARGKIITWTNGDVFEIKLDHRDNFMYVSKIKIDIPPEISDERTALLDAMRERTVVEIIVRITNELKSYENPNQTKLEVEY